MLRLLGRLLLRLRLRLEARELGVAVGVEHALLVLDRPRVVAVLPAHLAVTLSGDTR